MVYGKMRLPRVRDAHSQYENGAAERRRFQKVQSVVEQLHNTGGEPGDDKLAAGAADVR